MTARWFRLWLVVLSLLSPSISKAARSPGVKAVLFDLTDPLRPFVTSTLRAAFAASLLDLARGDTLIVYVLDGRSSVPREVWRTTSPGRAADADPFREGPGYLEDRFAHEVAAPFDSVIATLLADRVSSTSSAICGAVATVAISANLRCGPGRRLYLVSDLVENAPEFSFLRHQSLPDALPCPRIELTGVRVDLIVLLRKRDSAVQDDRLIRLWREYFERCGASVTLRPLGADR